MEPWAATFEKARCRLFAQRSFSHDGHTYEVAFLIRPDDWRPLKAHWWKGKEAYLIGANLDGNFLLRHCDGSVRVWVHGDARDLIIARSVHEFARMLRGASDDQGTRGDGV